MTPRGFDRFMVAVEIGSNSKIGRFTDPEFRCLITGVWPLAAKANPRGCLIVGGQPADASDVAHQARCSVVVARRTVEKMQQLRMLEYSAEHDCLVVHDWDSINPTPRDPGAADRQRRYRQRHRNATRDGDVTATVTRDVTSRNGGKLEVEGEVEGKNDNNTSAELRSAVSECFSYWQEKCGHPQAKLTRDREAKIRARLREGFSVADVRLGVDGAARAAFVSDDGRRFDDIELICRNGSKLEQFMARADVTAADVFQLQQRRPALVKRDAWREYYLNRDEAS